MIQLELVESAKQKDAARDLITEYLEWTRTVETDSLDAPTFRGLHTELATLPGPYAPPRGRLYLATFNGEPVGCGALKPVDDETAEIKRIYVRPAARGHGIGALLVNRVVADARAIGYSRVILDSHVSMTQAHALYRAAGFRDVDAPASFPESLKPVVVFMELKIGD